MTRPRIVRSWMDGLGNEVHLNNFGSLLLEVVCIEPTTTNNFLRNFLPLYVLPAHEWMNSKIYENIRNAEATRTWIHEEIVK